jgi:hypothetical protein
MSRASRGAEQAQNDARKAAGAALALTAKPDAAGPDAAAAPSPAPRPAPPTREAKPSGRKTSTAKAAAPTAGIAHSSPARVKSDKPAGTELPDGGVVGADQIVRRRTCKDCGFSFGRLQLRPVCQAEGACAKRQAKNLDKGLQADGQPLTEAAAAVAPEPEAAPEVAGNAEPEAPAVTNPVLKETPDSPGGEKPRSTPAKRSRGKKEPATAGPAGLGESAAQLAAAVTAAAGSTAASG